MGASALRSLGEVGAPALRSFNVVAVGEDGLCESNFYFYYAFTEENG